MDDFRSEAIWARAGGAVPTHGGAPLIRTARIETVVLEMPSSSGPCSDNVSIFATPAARTQVDDLLDAREDGSTPAFGEVLVTAEETSDA